ncbi:MAG: hypothetical protein A2504_06960 [Bdellovibrionales bacterium RIFOXYD12_FULL_39_22]|nr:MAG: hypothetical protein A2385_05175 [Bdellovibrionales bacterium RIFOXYB1_FULL_39_21]OFZ44314.1 MAG: hypothetical protein A2485_15955 [Bdellovibrionales bacterium RIFOXYC12_FULL_39_17]OFZ49169.1 MAG: hypothetical protein A2404_15895 [Bdellovibrionales bacterium RIFOXYC1_FULL_39_130]OFZ72245.1 MAG: hypothetical protein A2451_15800 [Bdellovibrionales bacterium RIFOXYC2_FULL_39_8]OFZ76977.1 MAG: hypothetical protein A2560_10980 [Bdellovibrionales bacterium RIFOXYD1_FULL_39_84]OFZ95190.1 MAG:
MQDKVKLSILILTHNRPILFQRCIGSALENRPSGVEIIVNNDSQDIKEIPGAKYFYEKHDDLSLVYKFLFDNAKGEFVYFLEDDDYLMKNFYKVVMGIKQNTIFRYFPEKNIKLYYEYFKDEGKFKTEFQLGQIIFKKETVKNFPIGNRLDNDFLLYLEANANEKFIKNEACLYVQTLDGKDNISYPLLNRDVRFVGDGCGI